MTDLVEGEILDQPTFHARDEAMGEDARAELIAGRVYLPRRVTAREGTIRAHAIFWVAIYEASTPGTEGAAHPTVILGPRSEPEPDVCLLVLPDRGGQTRYQDDYVAGPPELVVEVAPTPEGVELHDKKADYEKGGVREYVVVTLRPAGVQWFVLRDGLFVELAPDPDGLFRSTVFPGLWLDPIALLGGDVKALKEVVALGVASPEHAAFVATLASP